jgi:membrane protease YdiL (CAAX protease family)
LIEAHSAIDEKTPEIEKGGKPKPWVITLSRVSYRSSLEPLLVTGGLYTSLALYYTRISVWQIISGVFLVSLAFYWSRALRDRPMTLADLRLSRKHLGLQVLIGAGLAVCGWFFFRYYVYVSRGMWLPLGYGGSLAALFSIVAVASGEEFFFRGYLQNRLRVRYALVARVLIVAAALALYKNIIHMWSGMPFIFHVELFTISGLLALITSLFLEWSDNLAGPIVLHVVWDLLVYSHLATIPYWVF